MQLSSARTFEGTDMRLRPILCHPSPSLGHPTGHNHLSRLALCTKIAELRGANIASEPQQGETPGRPYFVPAQPLTSADAAALGIADEGDLFGGVVPHAYMTSKCITHPLVRADAAAPAGWTPSFAEEVRSAVLPGYSCYSPDDALAAGRQLLSLGPVRLKLGDADGGRDQSVARTMTDLEAQIAGLDAGRIAEGGLVLEQNLSDVATFSVGQVRIGPYVASYCGTQRLVPNNQGEEAYGGSRLFVVRGEFTELLLAGLDERHALAVRQARLYDAAAHVHFPGFFASRRNYDIVQGTDREGRFQSGVLEQSWRPGGASPAELLALLALRDDPSLVSVETCCQEDYGTPPDLGPESWVYYQGDDAVTGPLTKHARIVARTHAS